MKQIWALILITPLSVFAMDFPEAEKLIKPYDEATRKYLYERLAQETAIPVDEKAKCEAIPGGGLMQILRINQEGVIDLVLSNVNNERAACFEKIYLGRAFKAPPTSPIYIKQKIGPATLPQ